jgi:hypothetical protein
MVGVGGTAELGGVKAGNAGEDGGVGGVGGVEDRV